jgi:ornithine decarboxylase
MLGCSPDRIIFAHPTKDSTHLKFAALKGVKVTTFDSEEEADKIARICPQMELVLRIEVKQTDSPCPMSGKFGAPQEFWQKILTRCK